MEESKIELVPDEGESVDRALDQAGKDDLLLIFGDDVDRCWNQITSYQSGLEQAGAEPGDERPGAAPLHLDAALPADLDLGDAEIISDERGVRLARETDD